MSTTSTPVSRRWRLGLLVGVVLAVACRPVPTVPERSLRVATYNIAAGHGDLDGTTEAIAALRADVIALQEVDVHWSERSAWQDQASLLGARLGMAVRFAPIYTVEPRAPDLPSRQFGVALLSRHPIVAFTNRPLTRWSTLEPASPPKPLPGLLDATVRAHGLDLRILNTHLDYRADPAVRTQQVVELMAALETSSHPTVLLGDLNAPPDAPELAPLFTRLTDVWGDCTSCGFSYPADAPSRRIDHVLVSPNVRVRRAWVAATRASDHRPVVADLVLPALERAGAR
jgi:endonuclease/exonuclease/phosphatase family metal-dependent hydrolase